MDKRNLITITLLATALALNPLYAEYTLNTNTHITENRVSSNIASILHKRGLDEEAAREISEGLVNEEDELFALMIENLIRQMNNEVTKNEILQYLSTAALHRQKVELNSYAQLVHMVSKIKQKQLDQNVLEQLKRVAKTNTYFSQVYRSSKIIDI